ncbi:STAS/SEC14 domain-containing protein [uncultured Roseobacter sp.]|uniref:STAS/SEC14 domain-containing protein n=1 Tax=uncultured Roseobacter sp. TaxID=114847 RepID=UPI002614C00C|nr:STAS/SEC14 domain-containing protein [uncultured Roseobacter sp.]
MLTTSSITQIATSRDDLFAFRIAGKVSREDMTAMARYMNDVFDAREKVDMLLIFDHYDGAETGASLSWDSIKSRIRSISEVDRYVVVGAPENAAEMIETFGKLMPVETETYDTEEPAWRSLGAEAVPAA